LGDLFDLLRIGVLSRLEYTRVETTTPLYDMLRRRTEVAREWKEMGAQIIGGCCASGPEHIEALAPIVKGA